MGTLTLTVDGTTLVEAKAKHLAMDDEDDGGDDKDAEIPWVCRFYFVGERSVKFQVFEEAKNGIQLDSKDVVQGLKKEQRAIRIPCVVTVPNTKGLREAELEIGGKQFVDLKEPGKKSGESLTLHPD